MGTEMEEMLSTGQTNPEPCKPVRAGFDALAKIMDILDLSRVMTQIQTHTLTHNCPVLTAAGLARPSVPGDPSVSFE
ncbi:hypothetical protein GJ744_006404 [Endocarpon pusillum]|uniref:Uncharacterized protein n=1 Tax=Endocarpon pusillum TaxID=364733 RepID=A0A8H7AK40_9EURO|nr:hypothetical protein GJ744_006404 [Endocarpon pusillum]